MIVGFDFDGTLNSPTAKRFFSACSDSLNNFELIIITNRMEVDKEIVDVVKEIGLKEVKVYAIGAADYKSKAAFIADEDMKIDFFFENDESQIKSMSKIGISCFRVPE
jgi:hypothetical protein